MLPDFNSAGQYTVRFLIHKIPSFLRVGVCDVSRVSSGTSFILFCTLMESDFELKTAPPSCGKPRATHPGTSTILGLCTSMEKRRVKPLLGFQQGISWLFY